MHSVSPTIPVSIRLDHLPDIHESDDETKSPVALEVSTCDKSAGGCINSSPAGSHVTMPGTPLGAGQRLNLPRPETESIGIRPNLTANQWIDISEVRSHIRTLCLVVKIAAQVQQRGWSPALSVAVATVRIPSSRSAGSMFHRPHCDTLARLILLPRSEDHRYRDDVLYRK